MANFTTVLHMRKIKTMAGCIQVIRHNLRLKGNIEEFVDKTKSHHNYYNGVTDINFVEKFDTQTTNLQRKIQRNASRLIECVVSFSPEFSDGWNDDINLKARIDNYFDSAEKFLKNRYGDVIILRSDHFDETTPHSHFLLVPIIITNDGKRKFSSSEFLGGIKGLFDLHDKFYSEVGIHFGLDRGIKESRTKHLDLKHYNDWQKSQKSKLLQKIVEAEALNDLLQKQKEEVEKNEKELEAQKERIFDLKGDIMKRSEKLSKREIENDKIDKMHSELIPQIPVPLWRSQKLPGILGKVEYKILSILLFIN